MAIFVNDPLNASSEDWDITKFAEDRESFVKRPPYQRKTVWDTQKKRELIDSFVRQLYVPPVVLRHVVLEGSNLRLEVVDGQQRITAIQEFLDDEFALPDTAELRDLNPNHEIAGKRYSELDEDVKEYIDLQCSLKVIKFTGIAEPDNKEHQELATKVFWRLQQGEHLTNIEKNHSKTYSPVRNFIVETADDISFDHESYQSRDENPNRHEFFTLVSRNNDRLQQLSLLARFILIEIEEGPAKVTGKEVTKLFDCKRDNFTVHEDAEDFRQRQPIKRVCRMLDLLTELYRDTDLKDGNGEIIFLNKEYFILSLYSLIRELEFGDYNFSRDNYDEVRDFTEQWFKRFEVEDTDDTQMLQFKEARQQNRTAVHKRHYIIENAFWETDPDIETTDEQRQFSRAQRIKLFIESDRICELCLEDEEFEEDAKVSWSRWDADHVEPYADGGETTLDNARVLCPKHNRGR
ncbi:HNH endonuclease family protein [Halobaculum lipolyticum]|uniref:HNH endonuclease family protein n=1 Tax=Halobaculum lipolyticum TaxID=3032001 RepID=A0ABD5WBI8_9EURY